MKSAYFVTSCLLLMAVRSATSIKCYVCNTTSSVQPFQCSEWFERYDQPDIQPVDCENVHGAKYCVKHIGRFEAQAIDCYQCDSSKTIECSDLMINMPDSKLKPEPCDHVFEAEYCIKSTSLESGIGAIRYCSSRDLGNYCNYVKNKGDEQEYRSCIFTCNTDGCNDAPSMTQHPATKLLLLTVVALFIMF